MTRTRKKIIEVRHAPLESRPQLCLDLAAMSYNLSIVRQESPSAEVAAVVKADAYGLGAAVVVPRLWQEGVKTFFVAYAFEGEQVRQLVPEARIFVLHGLHEETLDAFHRHRLIPVLSTPDQVKLHTTHLETLEAPALHFDTGLNRLGLRRDEIDVMALRRLKPQLLMSHLASADAPAHFMNAHQHEEFTRLCGHFPGVPRSLSASDGIFLGTDYGLDLVRAGAALYGVNTTPYRENQMRAVLYLEAPVLQVADLPKGEYVGYGATYRALQDERIAVIALGYADGIPKNLGNRGKVCFFEGETPHMAPVVGKVSMDMTVVDVSHVPAHLVYPGAIVSALNQVYTVDDMGRDAGTIGYEILTQFTGRRLKRSVK